MTCDWADEFSHIWAPLKMEAAKGPFMRETLVALDEFCLYFFFQVAFAESFGEIAAIVHEAAEANDFDLRDGERFYFNKFHGCNYIESFGAIKKYTLSRWCICVFGG